MWLDSFHEYRNPISSRADRDSDKEQILRRLAPLLAPYDAHLKLFGSRARGDAGERSDIELAAIAVERLPGDALAQIREALEETTVPFRTNLVDYQSAHWSFKQAIDREGIEWIA